jgi:hypothetical protein
MDFRGRKFFLLLSSPPVDFSRFSSSNFPKYVRNLNTGGELYKETSMMLVVIRVVLPVAFPEKSRSDGFLGDFFKLV